ncbi:flavodoxin domain-containing protein [Nonomuraea sp. NBC_01738]|uniref:flavodoxin family protein n=1 Tax=Nonomuraea sp. NBC_01738 TaxID=2976003 RepID=UPI002E117254|nr:flavodoxin domain-containing protein [Nonomuraea sp. NBC_01738]
MYALVVYESMFGNTREIAEAVADGLALTMKAEVVEVGSAPAAAPDDVDLLVVGAPTHAFGMSRPSTRRSASEQAAGALVSRGRGLREWLVTVHTPSPRLTAAAFDTRISKPRLPGSAARAATRRLRGLGVRIAGPAASFYVTGTQGPLAEGEKQRARTWGEQLASSLAAKAG